MLGAVLTLLRPTHEKLARIAGAQRTFSFTYEGVGATLTGQIPTGYRYEEFATPLGHGDDVFGRACGALREWRPQRGAGLSVAADGPLAVGTTVALAAPLPVGFAVAVCRVVDVVDEPGRFGFAYGTLPEHPEEGEELFDVRRGDGGEVVFRIAVFSRPHQVLARLVSPFARRLQARATQRYLDAMRALP
jgi:uncharacterized protein (UPF0548 family)